MAAFPPERRIRVLIVEDSRAQQELLAGILRESELFTVVAVVGNGRDAVEQTLRLQPDVVAMDVYLPIMDGFEATRQIMQQRPTPVVMITSSAASAERRSAEALAAGAVTITPKPGGTSGLRIDPVERERFLKTLRLMAGVRLVTRRPGRPELPTAPVAAERGSPQILAIAASTGGPAAVQMVLQGLGRDFSLPVVVVQHISRGFLGALVDWLRGTISLPISVAENGERLQAGHIYLPPDDSHLMLNGRGTLALQACRSSDRYCPSADVLFNSVARSYGGRAIAVILTGMGDDGSRGLNALRIAGSTVLAQDEASCVVYGMPRAAVELGVVSQVVALDQMAATVRQFAGLVPLV
jgi:two-component system, chemotaxis family, protein-glutamate methylesterase/glutaminase